MDHKITQEELVYLRKGYYKKHKIGLEDESLFLLPKEEQNRLISLGQKPPSFFEKLDKNFGIVLTFIILIGGYALFQLALENKYFLWFVAIVGSPLVIFIIIFIASKNR